MKVTGNFIPHSFRKIAFGQDVIVSLGLAVAKGAIRRAGQVLF
jgi:hypothetical protein